MNILVINSGSSSIKYQLLDMTDSSVLAAGLLEQIGESTSRLTHRVRRGDGDIDELVQIEPVADHEEGFDEILKAFADTGLLSDDGGLYGIGHRVVHGGESFKEPTLITAEVIETIREQIPLAPLHNPANLMGIEVTFARMPDTPQVGVFDTAFHQNIPPHAFHYALPRDLAATYSVRRFGFHGTSHQYVTKAAAEFLGKPLADLNLITCHLGNGASVCAIRGGRSIDTSMGMTPLEGLIMGTRSGDLDPGVIFYLGRKARMSLDQLDALLNQRSGMKGLCGVNDMREIEPQEVPRDVQRRPGPGGCGGVHRRDRRKFSGGPVPRLRRTGQPGDPPRSGEEQGEREGNPGDPGEGQRGQGPGGPHQRRAGDRPADYCLYRRKCLNLKNS